MKQIKKTGRPLVLTPKGTAEAVALDTSDNQKAVDHLDAVAIRRSLDQAKHGLGQPDDQVFADLEREPL